MCLLLVILTVFIQIQSLLSRNTLNEPYFIKNSQMMSMDQFMPFNCIVVNVENSKAYTQPNRPRVKHVGQVSSM